MQSLGTLKAWTHAKDVARAAYRATMQQPLRRHFGLADQIRRAAASIPANIVEGYALGTPRQLVRCLRIAFGSACELAWHIELAAEMELLDPTEQKRLQEDTDLLIKLLIGLLKRLTRKQ
ncbi:MAG: four helix bundle protein [Gemmatimonadetes bacterium]|nr:four helix bundle protein [Gemmatimonadota bacterium]